MPTQRRAPHRIGLTLTATLVLALLLVLALAVPAVLAADRDVAIRDFAFAPQTVEVRVGDSVTWTNRDSVAHTATARNGSFDTGLLEEGESGTIRFNSAGTYRYVCTPHPDMTGTVVVRAAAGVVPPNTATAAIADAGGAAATDGRLELLAAIGGLAFLLADRAYRRRRSSR
jgi:plastocyanin